MPTYIYERYPQVRGVVGVLRELLEQADQRGQILLLVVGLDALGNMRSRSISSDFQDQVSRFLAVEG